MKSEIYNKLKEIPVDQIVEDIENYVPPVEDIIEDKKQTE